MKVEVLQDRLAKALSVVSRVAASTKAGLPILSNVLLRAEGKQLTLTATNLELATVEYVNAKVIKEGTITVPARLLADFISNLPKETITLDVDGEKLTVSAGKYKSTINGILADDYPELPTIDEKEAVTFRIPVEIFKEAVNQVIIAASNDTTRPALTGVFFNTFEGSLYIAATDGYRLADKKFVENVKSEIKAIIPTAALREVLSSLSDSIEEIEVMIIDSQIRFRLGEIEVTSKLIDASFPDYRLLIPKDNNAEIILNKAELLRMTKVAALFARESNGSIVCEAKDTDNSFSVSAVASELGENSALMEADVKESGKVTLNSKYLLDALNAATEDEISFCFSGKLSPVVIKNVKNNDYTHIIMPLKS
ncbi:DNA polymerase III subunit beta [Candidatus Saccharibacteria bacterium]|jgi:DNA polymerase-3 subunit beta|nr:DNA polymerase III subunit beta [Candidatus Saccharibacteria bacterium]